MLTMVFDEHRVVPAADGFQLVADVVAHNTQHDGKSECPQQEDGIHQDEAGGVIFRQDVDTFKSAVTRSLHPPMQIHRQIGRWMWSK